MQRAPSASPALVFAVCVLSACARGGLEYGSKADLEKLLASKGVTAAHLACENVREGGSVTRRVACRLSLTAAERATLAATMKLAPFTPSPSSLETNGCAEQPGLSSKAPTVEVLRGVEPHSGWTYYALFWDRTSGAACFETAYAWSS